MSLGVFFVIILFVLLKVIIQLPHMIYILKEVFLLYIMKFEDFGLEKVHCLDSRAKCICVMLQEFLHVTGNCFARFRSDGFRCEITLRSYQIHILMMINCFVSLRSVLFLL